MKLLAPAALFLLAVPIRQDPHAQDLAQLLDGVAAIASPGVPGDLCVFGPDAFPVVLGRAGDGVLAPVVAATRAEKGRIVAFGHTSYFDAATIAKADTARLLSNAVRWAAGAARKPVVGVRGFDGLRRLLAGGGFDVVDLSGDGWTAKLKDLHAACLPHEAVAAADDRAAVSLWIAKGGGLLWTTTGWGWKQLNPGKSLEDHPGNRLMAAAGLVWSDGTLDPTGDKTMRTPAEVAPYAHAGRALEFLASADPAKAPKADLKQAGWTMTAAARALPRDDELLRPRMSRLQKAHAARAVPTEKQPLRDVLPRLALTLQLHETDRLPAAKIQAHPAAAHFPGAVPASARRVTSTVAVDTRTPGWHSTGLYAPAGEVVSVKVADAAAALGLHLRIGCHTDGLWHHDAWRRAPDVATRRPIDAASTAHASAFGGLVYVEVTRTGTESVDVEIAGAVEAPFYVRGRTSADEWTRRREAPAPWAEIATSKVVVSIPSEHVRNIDDPEAVAAMWDRILDAAADLAGIPRERRRPERFVADVQISAGYMHSGYPIMTHLDAADDMTDVKLLAANWGLVHELGHNHQEGDWTFDGTGEVTNNVFSIYILEKVGGLATRAGHPALKDLDGRIAAHLKAGSPFERWTSDPFLALGMYVQLREAFGWEPYLKAFAEYRSLKAAERPKSDPDKRDQWMVRMSRAVGRNLGPFFEKWGVPTTAAARDSLRDLDPWLPDTMK